MRRQRLKWVFYFFMGVLAIFSGTQILLSFIDLMTAGSNLIQLTFVEPENNLEIQRHPYYTLCPVFEKSANLSNQATDLMSVVLQNTMYYPVSLFVSLLNSQSLTAERFSTWVKMKNASKDLDNVLVHCTTFRFPNNITLGKNAAKVWTTISISM